MDYAVSKPAPYFVPFFNLGACRTKGRDGEKVGGRDQFLAIFRRISGHIQRKIDEKWATPPDFLLAQPKSDRLLGLFAHGIKTLDDIRSEVSAVDRPVNVLMGMPGMHLTLDDMTQVGVKRLSVSGSLARAALEAFMNAATELVERGSFTYAKQAIPMAKINGLFAQHREESGN